MTMQLVSVSSKGQIAIPVSYRKALSIKEGSQLVVYSDGENIILKPVELPAEDKLRAALAKAREYAEKEGLVEDDIKTAIKESRKAMKELIGKEL